jgi:hypothetical protein
MSTESILRNGLYGFEIREEDRRRKDHSVRKTYEAKQMWQRHHEIVNLHVQGFKNVEIAEILCIDPQTVSNVLGSQLCEQKTAELREIRDGEVKKRMEQIRILTQKAIETYNEILDDTENEKVTLKDRGEYATRVLDNLSGLKVPTRVQTQSVGVQMTAEEFAEFKARGIAASREAGLVISEEEANEELSTQ